MPEVTGSPHLRETLPHRRWAGFRGKHFSGRTGENITLCYISDQPERVSAPVFCCPGEFCTGSPGQQRDFSPSICSENRDAVPGNPMNRRVSLVLGRNAPGFPSLSPNPVENSVESVENLTPGIIFPCRVCKKALCSGIFRSRGLFLMHQRSFSMRICSTGA